MTPRRESLPEHLRLAKVAAWIIYTSSMVAVTPRGVNDSPISSRTDGKDVDENTRCIPNVACSWKGADGSCGQSGKQIPVNLSMIHRWDLAEIVFTKSIA